LTRDDTFFVDSILNLVHDVNVVQETGRRGRARAARRDVFLDAARALVEERGIDAVTIKAVAERVDCAVGTMYTYFASKGSLLATLQAEAINRLGASYAQAAEALEGDLRPLDVDTAALARLVAFGRSFIVVGQVLPDDFRLQQRLLVADEIYDEADIVLTAAAAFGILARPERLLREGTALGVLEQGDSFNRTITWVAALNGALTLSQIRMPAGVEGIDAGPIADQLVLDLLRGWGADPLRLAAAADAVPRERIRELLAAGAE
jgi:AcrR family transcriptional regulator